MDDFYEYTPILGVESHKEVGSKVYPNPVKNELNIHLNNSIDIDEIALYTLSGKIIYQEKKAVSNNRITTNVTALSSGMYLYTAKLQGSIVAHGKFMVTK